MTSNKLTVELTEDLVDEIDEQMVPDNEVASMDCLALNPDISEQINGHGRNQSGYELTVYRVNVEGNEAFLLFCDDGEGETVDDFSARAHFYETEADAVAAMGAEYKDWLTRF